MASKTITVYQPHNRGTHALCFVLTNGRRIWVERLPRTIQFSEVATIGTTERQARKPITRNTGLGLRTLSFTQVIGNRGSRDWDAEKDLDAVLYIARKGWAFRISGAASRYEQTTWWQAVGCEVTITDRTPTNRATRAEIEWELQEYVVDDVKTRRPKPVTPTRKPAAKKTAKKAVARTYVARSGDSLWKISARLLGKGTRWREIYNLNRGTVKNPNTLRVGMKLKVPLR